MDLWLYRLLFPIVLLVLLPRYVRRMLKRGGYGLDFGQRLGRHPDLGPVPPGRRRAWIQAVSVGEIQAVGPVIERLAADPTLEIVLTTTTSTGYALARERHAARLRHVGLFPVDLWPCSALAWRRIQPDVVVQMEGELWAEHLHRARRRGVPVLLVNARLSDKTHRRLAGSAFARRLLLRPLGRVLAATSQDGERFRSLGVEPARLEVTGSLKFDTDVGEPPGGGARRALLDELGFGPGADGTEPLVVLGSSTWPGEETLLLDALAGWRAAGRDVRLLVVPRHAERRAELAALLEGRGLRVHFRSAGRQAPGPVDVHVGDTTGELRRLTGVADVVFVGKSLPPHEGGQTPVEAALLGKPMVFGPRMSNFRDIARALASVRGAVEVRDPAGLAPAIASLLADPALREATGRAARDLALASRGASDRVASAIRAAVSDAAPRG